MARKVGIVALVVVGIVLAVLLGGWLWLRSVAQEGRDERTAALAQSFTKHREALLADHRALAAHPLAHVWSPAQGEGRDAAELLNGKLEWTGVDGSIEADAKQTLRLSDELRASLENEGWWKTPEQVPLPTEELALLDSLRAYDRWELGAADSPLQSFTGEPMAAPMPSLFPLIGLMRARHAQGLVAGDTAGAINTGRAVARLLFSSSTLLGAMVGVAILSMEPAATEAARARGQALEGLAPLDGATTAQLKRAVRAAPVVLQLGGPTEAEALLPEIRAGRCAAIAENAAFARMLRPWVRDEEQARLTRLRALLDEPGCSFSWLRAAWDRPIDTSLRAATICWASNEVGAQGTDGCELAAAAEWLPGMRGIIGDILTAIAVPDTMGGYEKP